MLQSTRISQLKDLIQNLFEESSRIELKNPKLSAEDYLKEKHKLQSLKNLVAIAKNELNSMLYQYRYTIAGKVTGTRGEIKTQVIRGKFFSEIESRTQSSHSLSLSQCDSNLVDVIKRDYSTYFIDGTFEIKRLRKVA